MEGGKGFLSEGGGGQGFLSGGGESVQSLFPGGRRRTGFPFWGGEERVNKVQKNMLTVYQQTEYFGIFRKYFIFFS